MTTKQRGALRSAEYASYRGLTPMSDEQMTRHTALLEARLERTQRAHAEADKIARLYRSMF